MRFLALLAFLLTSPREQYAVWVWDAGCIKSISVTRKTRIEAPNDNGKPDMNNARLYGVAVDYIESCGHIEIRKK